MRGFLLTVFLIIVVGLYIGTFIAPPISKNLQQCYETGYSNLLNGPRASDRDAFCEAGKTAVTQINACTDKAVGDGYIERGLLPIILNSNGRVYEIRQDIASDYASVCSKLPTLIFLK